MNSQVFKVLPLVAAMAFVTDSFAQRQISDTLEETVVTAQKREENLQDVAISVSAMDAAPIESIDCRCGARASLDDSVRLVFQRQHWTT
ncbi:MAG: hypothetical protein P8J18_09365 [Halieaceae bacterium]|nr:hypothetical protein [Halieaceae bacterium]